jgi:hypothetical protein
MSRDPPVSELLVGPVVCVSFTLLVFPFAVSVVDARLWTPIALPGYTMFVLMTVVGDVLPVIRSFGFRLYWLPFLLVCYALSVAVAVGYHAIRR